jgi:hypothetical protein
VGIKRNLENPFAFMWIILNHFVYSLNSEWILTMEGFYVNRVIDLLRLGDGVLDKRTKITSMMRKMPRE